MPRPFASGSIAFGLVSIPVKLYSATEATERISFNMIHTECGSRIQQQLFCPRDERTIGREETSKGYEFAKGQYVLFSEEELKASDDFHPENYRDEVADRIRAMIQQKVDGEEITTNLVEEPKAQVIDLMEALKASLGGRGARQASAPSRMPIKAEAKRKPAK